MTEEYSGGGTILNEHTTISNVRHVLNALASQTERDLAWTVLIGGGEVITQAGLIRSIRSPAIPQRATPATVAQIEAQVKQVRREAE